MSHYVVSPFGSKERWRSFLSPLHPQSGNEAVACQSKHIYISPFVLTVTPRRSVQGCQPEFNLHLPKGEGKTYPQHAAPVKGFRLVVGLWLHYDQSNHGLRINFLLETRSETRPGASV